MNWRTIQNLKDLMIQSAQKATEFKINFKVALWAKAFIESMAEGLFSIQSIFKDAIYQLFPQYAKGEFLAMWGKWEGLPKIEAQPASGTINVVGDGVAGVIIPESTQFQSGDGIVYSTQAEAEIVEVVTVISDITISSGIATVTTATAHLLASGQSPDMVLDVLGAIVAESITVIDSVTFTFQTDEGNMSDAGTMTNYFVAVEVEALSEGLETNSVAGTALNLVDDIDDLKEQAFVLTDLTGGADEEDDVPYYARIALSRQQMRGVFTNDQNILAGLRVAGNSQIIPDNPTAGVEDTPKVAGFQPRAGEAVFYVIRRATDGSIESPVDADILAETKQSILDYGKLPSHVCSDDVYCFSPILYEVDVTLSIVPDNATVQTAVENSIKAYFQDNEAIDGNPTLNGLVSAINGTQGLTSFVMTLPVSITVPDKNTATAGTITFS